jgi:hypothetical protein
MRVKDGKRRKKKGKERSGEIGAATEGPNNTDIKIQEATYEPAHNSRSKT